MIEFQIFGPIYLIHPSKRNTLIANKIELN